VRKFVYEMKVLPHGYGQCTLLFDTAIGGVVVGNGWLFKPVDIVGCECLAHADRLLFTPLHIGIDHKDGFFAD
jgi:hypothetical protein